LFFHQDYEFTQSNANTQFCVNTAANADEKLSHLRPFVVLETLNLARYVNDYAQSFLKSYCNLTSAFESVSLPFRNIFFIHSYPVFNKMSVYIPVSHKTYSHIIAYTVFNYIVSQ